MPRVCSCLAILLAGAALCACAPPAPTSTTTPMTSSKPPHGHHPPHQHGHDPAGHAGHAAHAGHAGHAAHAGHGDPTGHDFKNAEEWAKSFDDPSRDEWQRPDEVIALLGVTEGMTVADVGAGTGYFVRHLVHATGPRGTVIATDVEPDMIRYLGQRAGHEGWKNIHPVQVPPDDPGLSAASVDRVLIVNVWHHLGDARGAYAAKLAAALRPGGRLAVVDYDHNARRGPPPEHRVAPEALLEQLRQAGLTATLARESLPEQYVIIATRAP